MDYLFPIENENVFLCQRCTHLILRSEFWICIQNVKIFFILDKYENQMTRINLYTYYVL